MRNWWMYLFLFLSACQADQSQEPVKAISETPVQDSLPFKVPEIPEKIMFCDEELALNDFESQERLQREFITNVYYHSATIQIILRSTRYFPEIDRILRSNGIPLDMRYLCVAESALSNVRSPAGALGFWQFMPETAEEYGLIVNEDIDERLHIQKSTQAACDYLKTAYQEFGDWALAAASYNMGKEGMRNALQQQRVNDFSDLYLNTETSRYVMRIVALKYILEDPSKYGFSIAEDEYYRPIETEDRLIEHSIPDLSSWAKANQIDYKLLRILNPWILTPSLKLAKNQQVTIQLPKE